MKFKVTLDKSTFVDLVDNEGVDHLIQFNEEYGHVYIEEDSNNDNTEPTMNGQVEKQEVQVRLS